MRRIVAEGETPPLLRKIEGGIQSKSLSIPFLLFKD